MVSHAPRSLRLPFPSLLKMKKTGGRTGLTAATELGQPAGIRRAGLREVRDRVLLPPPVSHLTNLEGPTQLPGGRWENHPLCGLARTVKPSLPLFPTQPKRPSTWPGHEKFGTTGPGSFFTWAMKQLIFPASSAKDFPKSRNRRVSPPGNVYGLTPVFEKPAFHAENGNSLPSCRRIC